MNTIVLVTGGSGSPHLTDPIAGRSILARTCEQATRSAYSCSTFLTCPADQLPPAGLPTSTHVVRACRAEWGLVASTLDILGGIEHNRHLYSRLPVLNGSSVVVVLRGDMPELLGRDLDLMVRWLVRESKCGIATLCRPATTIEKIDPLCRRLVRRQDGVSIRQFCREPTDEPQFRHLDCWAFRIETIQQLAGVVATTRSQQTGIEAVAWLENSFRILAADTDTDARPITAERFGQYRAGLLARNPWSRPRD